MQEAPQAMAPHFFGYGSLVNRATHDYVEAQHASLTGWRRIWVHTTQRPLAYLSVIPDESCTIHGLVARVPNDDWSALDIREYGYNRHPVQAMPRTASAMPAQVYAVSAENAASPQTAHPVLLSYIDTVIQGFLREFGRDGATHFFETTAGWHAPILNDRRAPKYSRAQALSVKEINVVNDGLESVAARII